MESSLSTWLDDARVLGELEMQHTHHTGVEGRGREEDDETDDEVDEGRASGKGRRVVG